MNGININLPGSRLAPFLNFSASHSESSITTEWHNVRDRMPNAEAIVGSTLAGDRVSLSFARLDQLAEQAADALLQKGIQQNSCIGICLPRSVEWVIAILAANKLGAHFVPIDLAAPSAYKEKIFAAASCQVVLTNRDTHHSPKLKGAILLWEELVEQQGIATTSYHLPLGSSLVYLMPTSGTTGTPKLVAIEHSAVVAMVSGLRDIIPVEPGHRYLHTAQFFFSSSIRQLFLPLLSGATVVIATEVENSDPSAFFDAVTQNNITHVDLTPSFLSVLSHLLCLKDVYGAASASAKRLHTIILASEPLHLSSIAPWISLLDKRSNVFFMYGQTETTGLVTASCLPKNISNTFAPTAVGRFGRHAMGFVLSPSLELCRPGQEGELHIAGPVLAREYYNSPCETKERFCYGTLNGRSSRFYKTGDLAVALDDGQFVLVGRVDHQVKIAGKRLNIREVEDSLLSHDCVHAATVAYDDKAQGGATLHAFVTLVHGKNVSEHDLLHYMKSILPAWKVPNLVHIVTAFPRGRTGKLDRKMLLQSVHKPDSLANVRALADREFSAISAIWSRILPQQPQGPDDDFFLLGGSSLLAIKAIAEIRRTFSIQLSYTEFSENRRLYDLYRLVKARTPSGFNAAQSGSAQTIPRQPRPFKSAATDNQVAIWTADLLHSASTSKYWIHSAIRLNGKISSHVAKKISEEMWRDVDTLRTVFRLDDTVLVQEDLDPDGEARDIYRYFTLVSADEPLTADEVSPIEKWLPNHKACHPPLFRISHFCCNADDVICFSCHHAIADRESLARLLEDFVARSINPHLASSSRLSRLDPTYSDYSHWCKTATKHPHNLEALDYWERLVEAHITDAPSVLPPRRFSEHPLDGKFLTASSTTAFLRTNSVSLHDLILTLAATSISEIHGKRPLLSLIDFSERGYLPVDIPVGCFVSQLPVFVTSMGPLHLAEDTKRTGAAVQAAIDKRIPYGEFVSLVRSIKGLSSPPIVFKLVYQDSEWSLPHCDLAGATLCLRPKGIPEHPINFFVRYSPSLAEAMVSIDIERCGMLATHLSQNWWNATQALDSPP